MDEHRPLAELIASLTTEQKATLVRGWDFWHTTRITTAGIESIMVADGPHGLRKAPGRGDHVGVSGSVPATRGEPNASRMAAFIGTSMSRPSIWDTFPKAGRPGIILALLTPTLLLRKRCHARPEAQ